MQTCFKGSILGALALACLPAASFAACDIEIQSRGDAYINNYQADNRRNANEVLPLRLVNNGKKACTGRLFFRKQGVTGHLRGGSQDVLDYWVAENSQASSVIFDPNTDHSAGLSVRIPAGGSRSIDPRFILERGQDAEAGLYSANLDVVFQSQDDPSKTQSQPLGFQVDVDSSAQANFKGMSRGRGRHYTLDMGELTPKLRKQLGLQIRANTHVSVSIESDNRGQMKHETQADGEIAYDMKFRGQTVDLSGRTHVRIPARQARRGTTSNIDIQLEDFKKAPAGDYSDVIVIRVTAL